MATTGVTPPVGVELISVADNAPTFVSTTFTGRTRIDVSTGTTGTDVSQGQPRLRSPNAVPISLIV